jgi:hypothetical protein
MYRAYAVKVLGRTTSKASLILQAAYRGTAGRREARKIALADEKIICWNASVSIQCIIRGKQSRDVVGAMFREVEKSTNLTSGPKDTQKHICFRKKTTGHRKMR